MSPCWKPTSSTSVTAAQETEAGLAPFMRKRWSIEQRANFVKAAQAVADATEQSLTRAAEIVLSQMEAGKRRLRENLS